MLKRKRWRRKHKMAEIPTKLASSQAAIEYFFKKTGFHVDFLDQDTLKTKFPNGLSGDLAQDFANVTAFDDLEYEGGDEPAAAMRIAIELGITVGIAMER